MKSDFCVAVHAIVYLNHKGRPVSSEELAENICTNPARVRKILSPLKKKGIISSKEGLDGGYSFDLKAEETTLDMIAEGIKTKFVSVSWRSGKTDMDCLISSGMAGIMEEITLELDRSCYDSLKKITVADIDKRIFVKEGNI